MVFVDCETAIKHGLGQSSDCCPSCHSDAEMFDDLWEMHGLYDPTQPFLVASLFGNICCAQSRVVSDEQAWELYQKLTSEEVKGNVQP